MNESNISRDHIALEAMKIILDKSIKQRITPVQRIRKLAGLRYEVRSFSYTIPETWPRRLIKSPMR